MPSQSTPARRGIHPQPYTEESPSFVFPLVVEPHDHGETYKISCDKDFIIVEPDILLGSPFGRELLARKSWKMYFQHLMDWWRGWRDDDHGNISIVYCTMELYDHHFYELNFSGQKIFVADTILKTMWSGKYLIIEWIRRNGGRRVSQRTQRLPC